MKFPEIVPIATLPLFSILNPDNINSCHDLVVFLNELNMTWTNTTQRLSPIIDSLETTGKQFSAHLQTLNPFENALFSVTWSSQQTFLNRVSVTV